MRSLMDLGSILKLVFMFGNLVILIWNVSAASRIVKDRRAPRVFLLLTAIGALLILPALIIGVSASSVEYGTVVYHVAWAWPLTAAIFFAQAAYSLIKRMVTPLFGVPILIYNFLICLVATIHLANGSGWIAETNGNTLNSWFFALSSAHANAIGHIVGVESLGNSMWLLIPLFAPALPSRSRVKAVIRTGLGLAVISAVVVIILEIPNGYAAVTSYNRYDSAYFQERPLNDFKFGLQILPALKRSPPSYAVKRDVKLYDSLNFRAVSIVVTPEALAPKYIDSIGRVIDMVRGENTTVILTLGYSNDAAKQFAASRDGYTERRLKDLDRIARALKPTVIIPATDPYGKGALVLGTLSPEYWIDYFTRSAEVISKVNPNIYVAMSSSSFGPKDSVLYSWASGKDSPLRILGFTFFPSFDGAVSLDTKLRVANRWMRQSGTGKPHWVWSTGGYPVLHGEQSQTLAVKGVISWAAAQPRIRGVVISEAGDYTIQTGIQSPSGRMRSVGEMLLAVFPKYDE